MATTSKCIPTAQQLEFKVIRQPAQLVPPVAPTPYEFKELSNIDEQGILRLHYSFIMLYPSRSNPKGLDPVSVIKDALSKALVPYYPLAGRLREKEGTSKLVVECNGEGVLFVEAHAPNLSLADFYENNGGLVTHHVPCIDQLLHQDYGFSLIHSPLLLFQVTRLRCGGFVLALRKNHTLLDAAGLIQFLSAMAEIVRGEKSLSIWPVWDRHLFVARDPPQVTCPLLAYEHDVFSTPITSITPKDYMVTHSFFFGPAEISALRKWIPPHLKSSTTFEVVSACLWRCRTIAISPDPEELVRFTFTVNIRLKHKNLVPMGYYGNAVVFPMTITTAKELGQSPLGYAVELIQKAKAQVTEEYIKSVIDLMEIKGRPSINMTQNFMVTDISGYRFILEHLDYGLGPPVYAGPTLDGLPKEVSEATSIYVSSINSAGEKGLMCLMRLPSLALERFQKEIQKMLDMSASDGSTYSFSLSSS